MRKSTHTLVWFTLAAVCAVSLAAQTKPKKKTKKRPAPVQEIIVTARPEAMPSPSPKPMVFGDAEPPKGKVNVAPPDVKGVRVVTNATPPPPPKPAPDYSPAAWKEFTSSEGRFKLLFPGLPRKYATRDEGPGYSLEIQNFMFQSAMEYFLAYLDYPVINSSELVPKRLFDTIINNNVTRTKSELMSVENIKLEEYPGAAYAMKLPMGTVIRARMYLVQSRLYILSCASFDKDTPETILKSREEWAAKFFASFKLTTPNEATPSPSPTPPSDVKGETMGNQTDLTNPITPCEAGEGPTVEKLGKVYGAAAGEEKAAARDSVLNGRAVSLPKPAYPAIAKAARAGGTVGVQIIIDEEGKVISARTVSGHPLLFATSLKAACAARFSPTLLEGKPVKVTGIINYNFVPQ